MSALFFINLIALFISLFVGGVLVGALLAPPPEKSGFVARIQRRLRALVFGWEFPPFNSGGLGVASLGLTRALSAEGTDIVFVVPKKLDVSAPYARFRYAGLENDIRAINSPITPYLAANRYASLTDGTPLYGADMVSEANRYAELAADIAREEPHDVIYAHDWLSFGAGRAAKKVSGRPLVAHVHATEFDRAGGDSINQQVYDIERAALHDADRVIAVSHRIKGMLVGRYGVPSEKVHVVWNGIDEATAPAAAGVSLAGLKNLKRAGYKLVLFLGRLTLHKGPDYFIRAAARVVKRDGKVLFIVAGAGDMEHQIMEQAAALGLSDKVFFTGFLRGGEQHEAYALADLYVMPSVSEPFGITALEALRVGTPVIVSKQSGVAEAVPSAIRVDFWDTEKLADHILSVLYSPALAARLVAEGQKEVKELTWERAGRAVKGVMDELAGATI